MAIGPITGYALHATELLETWGGDFLASDPTVCTLTYFVLCWAIHLVGGLLSSLLVPSVYTKFTNPKAKPGASKLDAANYLYQKQVDWGLDLTSIISCAALGSFYSMVVYRAFIDPSRASEDRWTLVTPFSTHGFALQLGMTCYELIAYTLAKKAPEFFLHHVLCLGVFSSVLYLGRAHGWVAWCSLVEWTNVPLCMMTTVGKIPSMKLGLVHKTCGAILWVSYVIFRVISPPMCYYFWYYKELFDPQYASVAWVSKDPTVNNVWFVCLFVTFLIIEGLSLFWFYLISKGLFKALGLIKPSAKKA